MSKYTEKEIGESFEKALEKGEVTDVMGNPMTKKDFTRIPLGKAVTNISRFEYNMMYIKSFQGKILTIIDATYEPQRAKYVKDLVKAEFVILGERFLEDETRATGVKRSNPLK